MPPSDAPSTPVRCPRCGGTVDVPSGRAPAHGCGAVFGLRPMGACVTQEARVARSSRLSRRRFVDHAIETSGGTVNRWFYATAGPAFAIRPGDDWAVLFGMTERHRSGVLFPRIELRPSLLRLVNLTLGGPGQEIAPAAGVPEPWRAEAVALVEAALPRLDATGPVSSATTRQIARARRVGRSDPSA